MVPCVWACGCAAGGRRRPPPARPSPSPAPRHASLPACPFSRPPPIRFPFPCLRFYDVVQGTGAEALPGKRIVVHYDCKVQGHPKEEGRGGGRRGRGRAAHCGFKAGRRRPRCPPSPAQPSLAQPACSRQLLAPSRWGSLLCPGRGLGGEGGKGEGHGGMPGTPHSRLTTLLPVPYRRRSRRRLAVERHHHFHHEVTAVCQCHVAAVSRPRCVRRRARSATTFPSLFPLAGWAWV